MEYWNGSWKGTEKENLLSNFEEIWPMRCERIFGKKMWNKSCFSVLLGQPEDFYVSRNSWYRRVAIWVLVFALFIELDDGIPLQLGLIIKLCESPTKIPLLFDYTFPLLFCWKLSPLSLCYHFLSFPYWYGIFSFQDRVSFNPSCEISPPLRICFPALNNDWKVVPCLSLSQILRNIWFVTDVSYITLQQSYGWKTPDNLSIDK